MTVILNKLKAFRSRQRYILSANADRTKQMFNFDNVKAYKKELNEVKKLNEKIHNLNMNIEDLQVVIHIQKEQIKLLKEETERANKIIERGNRMKYLQLFLTITIFIFLFVIINNQNKQMEYQETVKIQFKNISYDISQLDIKTAKNTVNDSLKIKLIDILQDLEEAE